MPRDATQLKHKQCRHDSDQNNATDCKKQLKVDGKTHYKMERIVRLSGNKVWEMLGGV
jgi:hypothetical protein